MIVEDEPEILDSIAEIVSSVSPNIIKAVDGKHALELFKNNKVAFIISDINMPRMNGLEFLKEIRKLGYDTPIIFVTAFSEKKLMVEAFRLGATDYIEKPFEIDHLLKIAQHAYDLGVAVVELETELDLISQKSNLPQSKLKKLRECQKAVRLMTIENNLNDKRKKTG